MDTIYKKYIYVKEIIHPSIIVKSELANGVKAFQKLQYGDDDYSSVRRFLIDNYLKSISECKKHSGTTNNCILGSHINIDNGALISSNWSRNSNGVWTLSQNAHTNGQVPGMAQFLLNKKFLFEKKDQVFTVWKKVELNDTVYTKGLSMDPSLLGDKWGMLSQPVGGETKKKLRLNNGDVKETLVPYSSYNQESLDQVVQDNLELSISTFLIFLNFSIFRFIENSPAGSITLFLRVFVTLIQDRFYYKVFINSFLLPYDRFIK